jgi:hypothetical protein
VPSLSDRLKSAQPNAQNKGGCVTCKWWASIKPETQRLINEWIDNQHSIKQLHDILSAPTDGGDPPLLISITGFRLHLNHHDVKCRDN